MSDRTMYPSDLNRILHRAGGDSRLRAIDVGELDLSMMKGQHDKKHPRVGIYYQRSICSEPVMIAKAERNYLPPIAHQGEEDPWFAERAYERYSWRHTLAAICANDKVPLHLRRKVYKEALKAGFTDFLNWDVKRKMVAL